MNLKISDVRVFVPAKDFDLSKAFYEALGWRVKWQGGQLAVLELGDRRFYLNAHYRKECAESFRLHITVEDAKAWHEHIASVLVSGNFPNALVSPPKQEDYGALVTYAYDPSGVLLDFAQWTVKPQSSN